MDTTDIRKGLKIVIDDQPYIVVEAQFVKPGKGQAFTRVKIRNMQTGAVLERTWKSGEKVELADVEQKSMQYIYPEGGDFVFMDAQSGEQITVNGDKIGDDARWLSDGMSVDVTIYRGNPIGVELPAHVVLQIVSSEPGVKGDTASGATKPATLSTGATVNVPLFISEGEWVKIDTREGTYLERVNRR
jgi:elongation factor P